MESAEELKARKHKWYLANKEREHARMKRHLAENLERINQWRRDRYKAKAEQILEQNRQWRERNPDYEKQRYADNTEAIKEKSRRYIAANTEKIKSYSKRYYAANADARRENARRWVAANPDKAKAHVVQRRARKKGAEGSHTPAEWRALVEKFDGCCVCCGKHFGLKNLTRDHVIPLTWGGSNFIENIQPLCYSDNSRKRDLHATDYRLSWKAAPGDAALKNTV